MICNKIYLALGRANFRQGDQQLFSMRMVSDTNQIKGQEESNLKTILMERQSN